MEVIKNRKKIKAIEFFPSVNDFIEEIKLTTDRYNFESDELKNKINKVYKKLIDGDGSVKLLRLCRWLYNELNFKSCNILQINFWLERGWDLEVSKQKISDVVKKGCPSKTNTIKQKKLNIVFDGEEKTIRYKSVEFKTTTHPTCNVCKNNLNLKKINIKNFNDLYYYRIVKCSNDFCETKNHRNIMLYDSFLPKDISEKKINQIKTEIKKRNRLCLDYWVNKGYSEEESIKIISESQKKSAKLVKTHHGKSKKMLRNLGYTEDQIKEICLTPANIKFWLNKGYTEEDAKKKISQLQSNASKHVDYEKRLLPSNLEYWIKKGYSKEESKRMVKESQSTFSLAKCVERYGEEEGLKRFTERQNKWLNSLLTNGNMVIGYSKISQELFYKILEVYNIDEKQKVYFATHNGEFKIEKEEGGVWLYDFTDTINKKIIEFHGDMYHGNPKKYKSDDYPHPFRKNITAKEMWDKDKRKIDVAIEEGFEVLVIWDSEYRYGDKEKIINKCVEFLKKNNYICNDKLNK